MNYKNYIVLAEGGLHLRSTPEISEGNIVDVLPDKSIVFVLSQSNDWYEVCAEYENKERCGWVYSEFVVSADEYVPEFIIGQPNYCKSANTVAVRAIIDDEFRGGRHRWDLQCTEYVQYKLNQIGIKIDWPIQHSRNGGRWSIIFNKYEMYDVSDEPSEHSAMCFTSGVGTSVGHVAFVESVEKNGTINISEVNWPGDGKYNERKMQKHEWRDKYKGKFVRFS